MRFEFGRSCAAREAASATQANRLIIAALRNGFPSATKTMDGASDGIALLFVLTEVAVQVSCYFKLAFQ